MGAIEFDDSLTGVGDRGLRVQVEADDHLEGVDLARVHPVLWVREGDKLVAAGHLEVEDAVLDVRGHEHLALLARQQQDAWVITL